MELDALRQHWQQSAADSPAFFDEKQLAQLLAKAGRNPLDRLRRNAWWELGFTGLLLVASGIGLFYLQGNQQRAMLGCLVLLCIVSLLSYHRRMLSGIQELSGVGATMRTHIAQRIAEVRQSMAASYRSTIWVLFMTMGISLCFAIYRISARHSGRMVLPELGWLALGYAIAGLIGYFAVRFLARRVLQDLYGQHLDRLEALLRELSA